MKNKHLIAIGLICATILGFAYITAPQKLKGSLSSSVPTYSNVATSGVIAITTSAQVLATSTNRGYAVICNTTATNAVYLSFRADVVPADGLLDYELGTGECYEIDRDNLYVGAVRATSSTGIINLTVTEFDI